MKTLTEFTALQIKNAAKTKQDLITAGKTPEELPQALGEALKIEGDKLNFLINALDLPMQKTSDLKRVIVMALGEGEQVPSNAAQKGEQVYVAEYYAPLHGATPPQKAGHGEIAEADAVDAAVPAGARMIAATKRAADRAEARVKTALVLERVRPNAR